LKSWGSQWQIDLLVDLLPLLDFPHRRQIAPRAHRLIPQTTRCIKACTQAFSEDEKLGADSSCPKSCLLRNQDAKFGVPLP
jgi:hypothetical protein